MDNQFDSQSARYETSAQTYREELSLKNMTQILFQNWALFLLLFILFSVLSTLVYQFKIPYQSLGSIIINDSKNSSLQSFANQFTSQNSINKTNEAKKANSSVQKNIEYLSTVDFLGQLILKLTESIDVSNLNAEEMKGRSIFLNTILKGQKFSQLSVEEQLKSISILDQILKVSLKSDFQADVIVKSMDKSLAYFVAKNSLAYILDNLKQLEKNEVLKIKTFLTEQKSIHEKEIQELNNKLSAFQSKPENLISLSANKVGDYISELMMRKSEIKMKISENTKIIDTLTSTLSGRRDSALYGNTGRIQVLKIENEMMQSKLIDLQKSVDQMMSRAKIIPTVSLTYDELKKKIDFEFEKFKDTSAQLSKIDAADLSINNKFEILENPRLDRVLPILNPLVLALICLFSALAWGCLIIYIRTIWDTKYITAEHSRNVVVVNGHSLDPRVIIENTKIKFSLMNHTIQNENEQLKNHKKIEFGIKNSRAANSDDSSQ